MAKNMVFCDCFVFEVLAVDTISRFYNRICIASQEKENEILHISSQWRNGSNYSWLSTTQNPKREKAIIRLKHTFVQDNVSSGYWMWFFISFAHKGPVR